MTINKMAILRSGLKSGLIGFTAMCLLELLRILPPLYCIKGIFQIFLFFIIGMLAAYFYLRDIQVISLNHILLVSVIASMLTVCGGLIGSSLLKPGLNFWLVGDMMFPSEMDPLEQLLPFSILGAAVIGIIGAFTSIGIWRAGEKSQIQIDVPADPDQKSIWKWLNSLWSMLLGGSTLTLLVASGVAILTGDESGNLHSLSIMDFIVNLFAYTFVPGAIAGFFIYTGRNIGARKIPPINRIQSTMAMTLGVFIFISVCMALALFILTLNMM